MLVAAGQFAVTSVWEKNAEISITKLLVVAALVVLLFGTKKLRTLGGDLGAAIKGFKKAMNDDDAAAKKGADVDLQAEKLSHKE
ncbi:twin-arginine translocase subunit TatE [Escherichia coli]|uniref:twin-arginine translocase subunit TatE n=1 Tax=Escherichia coli TaxID=562 RepID=UPI000B7E7442|nr:twin-arginine translocase subunit TatE [Escherichia coli]